MLKAFYQKLISLSFIVCYRKMWQFVKPIWFRALISLIICIPIGAMDGLIAYSLKPYTDTVMLNKTTGTVSYWIPLAIIIFTATQGVLNYIADYLNVWVGGKMTMALKLKLYRKLVNFETDFFDKTTSGEILFRFNSDANDSCATLLNNLKLFITRIVSAISLFFVLIYNSWQLSLIALLFLLIAILPLSKIILNQKIHFKQHPHGKLALAACESHCYYIAFFIHKRARAEGAVAKLLAYGEH